MNPLGGLVNAIASLTRAIASNTLELRLQRLANERIAADLEVNAEALELNAAAVDKLTSAIVAFDGIPAAEPAYAEIVIGRRAPEQGGTQMVQKVTLTNGEKVRGCGVTIYDAKGKPYATAPEGATVSWSTSPDGATIAQVKPQDGNPLAFDVTTEGDDTGVIVATADIRLADGTQMLDADGAVPSLEITVVNSAPSTASISVGTVEPE